MRKNTGTYTRVLNKLRELQPGLSPESILSDFEQAAIHDFKLVFPTATAAACFFHLKQSIQRNIQDCGLTQNYREESRFREAVQLLPALAFLKPTDVAQGFEDIQDHVINQEEGTSSVFEYFERTYIGVPLGRNRTRREPPFPPSLWSCHERVVDELPKTNNSVEAWHRSVQSALGFQHPDPYRLVEALKTEQSLTQQKDVDGQRGRIPSGSKPYARVSQRLRNVLSQYDTQPLIRTLLGCRCSYFM
ncbi:unnamed protein product [Ixodes hexagonus]